LKIGPLAEAKNSITFSIAIGGKFKEIRNYIFEIRVESTRVGIVKTKSRTTRHEADGRVSLAPREAAAKNESQVPEFGPPNARPPLMLSLCANLTRANDWNK